MIGLDRQEPLVGRPHMQTPRSFDCGGNVNLGYALKDSGRLDEAVAEWEQTLRLAPADRAALHDLVRIGRGPCMRAYDVAMHSL